MRFSHQHIVPITYVVFLAVASLLLNSCTKSGSTNVNFGPDDQPDEKIANIDFDKIKERGYLTAIMDNSSTGLFIYKGATMGYEYELLKLFCKAHDLELRIDIVPNLEESFSKLNRGDGDIIAHNLTVTKSRKKRISFTHYHNLVKMVLIQRKPENWRQMKLHEIERTLIRNPIDLIGKEIVVRYHSSYYGRLQNLSDEIGGDIIVVQAPPEAETEEIIRLVAEGEINYTVAEEDIALVNATYYPILDIKTPVSFPTQIAWGVRKNSDELLDTINNWILQMRKTVAYHTLYDKYFRSTKASLRRTKSDFFSLKGDRLSPYDSLIKHYAKDVGWDWRLLAAQIFKESKFNPQAKSWAGAQGLLQLLPNTAKEFGITDLYDPAQNIYAGTRQIMWLQDYFDELVADSVERRKFILAAYNVGHGHVVDAMRLTEKYGKNPELWDENVSEFLLKKSQKDYFTDPVVQFGYCRGIEPVTYVSTIYSVFENYKEILEDDDDYMAEDESNYLSGNTLPQVLLKQDS